VVGRSQTREGKGKERVGHGKRGGDKKKRIGQIYFLTDREKAGGAWSKV